MDEDNKNKDHQEDPTPSGDQSPVDQPSDIEEPAIEEPDQDLPEQIKPQDQTAIEEPTIPGEEDQTSEDASGESTEDTGDDLAESSEGTSEKSEPSNEDEETESAPDEKKLETDSEKESEEENNSEEAEEKSEDKPATNPAPVTEGEEQKGRWYVVHTFSGHENRVAATLRQRIDSEHLENKIFEILVPTQDKIEIRAGKKETVKEKIFPGYILVRMILDDESWLAVRTTQGVTSFVGAGNKPTPITNAEVNSIVKFTSQGAQPTFKEVFMVDDTVKIIDGPFADFIGKVDSVDTEKGRVRVLVSIFGRETPVELDFLQVTKL